MLCDNNVLMDYFIKCIKNPSNVFNYSDKCAKCCNQKICVICYENFDENSTIYNLVCNHIFHKKCLLEWSKYSDFCPICKEEL